MRELWQRALAPLRDWRLDVLQVLGNALLLGCAALWLLIPEAHVWQLIFAFVSGPLIVFAFTWLHCGTLAHGVSLSREAISDNFRRALRHLPMFVVLIALLLYLMDVTERLSGNSWRYSGYWFTLIPKFLQTLVGYERFARWIEFKFSAVTWFLLPALFLPILSAVSFYGFQAQGWKNALRTYIRWRYWLVVAIAAVVGIWLPNVLVNWKPARGLSKETISMVLRLVLAYGLSVMTWMMTSALVGKFVGAKLSSDNRGQASQ